MDRRFGGQVARPPRLDSAELLAENEELIAGRRPVEEAFAARREAVRLLIVPERRAALDALAIHATTLRIPVVEVEGGTLTALAGFDGHQGVALIARPRQQATFEDILTNARQRGEAPFVLVLDSLEDPQNFGTLLRSAEAVGVHGVIYPKHRAAPLSPAAIKAAAGATEHLLMAAVDDLPGSLADLHGVGLRIVAAEEDAALSYAEADLRGPLALVVGSEGRGISGPVRRRLDMSVRIPMRGKIGSLNAAVAGSVLLFAAAGQRPAPAVASTEAAEATTPVPTEEPVDPQLAAPKAVRKPATRATKAAASTDKPATGARKPAPKRAAKPAAESKPAPERAKKPPVGAEPEPEPNAPPKPKRESRSKKPDVPPTGPDEELLPKDSQELAASASHPGGRNSA